MLEATLKSLINKLWDRFWSGGIANPLNAIEQMTYLLFMKHLEVFDNQKVQDKANGLIASYNSVFDGNIKLPAFNEPIEKNTLRWSKIADIPEDEILSHMQLKVFPFIRELGGENSFFTKHMVNAVFLIPKPSLMRDAYKTINDIFDEINREAREEANTENKKEYSRAILNDIQGDVYEHLLEELKTAGKNGQFRTRTHIVQLVIELVFADITDKNEFLSEDFRIADPACGSATFLLGAFKYILTQFTSPEFIHPTDDKFMIGTTGDLLPEASYEKLTKDTFFGYDMDPTMVRIGLMNLLMHGITQPQIDYNDTLSKNYNENARYKAVFANPPFTGSIDKDDKNESLKIETNKTELLFIERIHQMLINGGTAGIIIPQGVLFGSGKAFVETRKLMIEQAELKAVITMPSGVFKPYAGVATAILIFTKGGTTENVWFYEMKSDGYTLDDKRQPDIEKSDLQDIIQRFKNRDTNKDTDRSGSKVNCFFVTKNEIIENNYDLSLNKYKEEVYTEISYDEPKEILKRLNEMEKDIQKELKELSDIFVV